MIDAHTHLNLESENPIQEYIDFLNETEIESSVLILNSMEESNVFWDNKGEILDNHNVHVAFLLDINNTGYFENNVKRMQEYGLSYSIKLHPRLTNISEKDFGAIAKYVENFDYKNIIIDSFLYGSNKDSICFIELSTFLAKIFSEKNIVMAHFGGIKVLETMLRTREIHNIFYDCSFSMNYLFGTSVWTDLRHCILHNINRVIYGSDRPSFCTRDSKSMAMRLLGNQSEEIYSNIFTENARRLYFK